MSDQSTASTLAALWRDHLGLAEVGPETNFLDEGGTSIAAVHLAAGIQMQLAVAVDAIEIIEQPTFAEILALVDERVRA